MNMKKNDLSVLMSVYRNESAENFEKSLNSVFAQTLRPSKLVLVKDGPLSAALETIISNWARKEKAIFHVVSLEKNCGLAIALNEGLKFIDSDLIARMDSDDIAIANRFEKQVKFLLENPMVDVVGSWIAEIDENDLIIKREVRYPNDHQGCYRQFAFRDPVAHPAVMFRQRFFQKAGVYSERHVGENKNEDTDLWYRGLKNNCLFANYPEVLLNFRRSGDFYIRRSGLLRGKLIFKDRMRINKDLGYGFTADLFALAYFFLGISPRFIRKLLYQYLR